MIPMLPITDGARAALVGRLRDAGCVFAEDEAALLIEGAQGAASLEFLVAQRVSGIPIEQILGWAMFAGQQILVDPGVFVPRRRTELLAAEAFRLLRSGDVLVDLCCGTGAVAAVLATWIPALEVHAVDIDPPAAECARRNLGVGGAQVYQGDLYQALPSELRGQVHVICANAPYVPTEAIGSMPPEARLYEPVVALDGGADGLDVQRRVVAEAVDWLVVGGHLLVETSRGQASRTLGLFRERGFAAQSVSDAELDATAVVGSTRSGSMAG
jgi:release factor glutamine methyltransferase